LVSLEKKGMNITTCIFENAKDADEAIKNDPVSFKKSIKKDISIYDFIFSKTFSSFEKDKIYGKRKISEELLPIFTKISNEIVKEHYLRKLSVDLGVSLEALSKEAEKIEKKDVVKENVFVSKKDKKTRIEVLEDYLMALIIQNSTPKLLLEKSLLILKDYKFKSDSYRKILDSLGAFLKASNKFDSKEFSKFIPKELIVSFDTAYLFPLLKPGEEEYEREVEKVAGELRILFLKSKIKEISLNLKKGEKNEDFKNAESLEKELSLAISLLGKP